MKKVKNLNINPLSYTSIPLKMYLEETKQELASGTGFVYARNDKLYLITNWHNATGINPITREQLSNHGGIPDMIVFALLFQKVPFIKWKHFSIKLYDEERKPGWLIHPKHREKVDVIAIEIEHDDDFKGIFNPINKIEFDNFDLEISDDVFILGYPYRLNGGGHFPIWKRGSVATEPDIDYDGLPKILVDTATRPGMSGSPVIFRRYGIHGAKNGVLTHDTVFGEIQGFVGIYSGRIAPKNKLDAQLGIVWKKEAIDEIIDGELKDNIDLW